MSNKKSNFKFDMNVIKNEAIKAVLQGNCECDNCKTHFVVKDVHVKCPLCRKNAFHQLNDIEQ